MSAQSALLALPVLACLVVLARASGGRLAWLTELPFALPLGIGVSSVVWWILLALFALSPQRLVVADLAFWTIAILFAFRTPTRTPDAPTSRTSDASLFPASDAPISRSPGPLITAVSAIGFLGALAFAVTGVMAFTRIAPHGTWDAWAIWNLRARFFFHAPLAWQDAFSQDLAYSHPDYPLLLPLSVSRAWTFAGTDTTLVPIGLAATFGFAVAAIVGISVARAKAPAHGLIAASAVLVSPAFLKWAPSQIADIPIAVYMLAAFVMLWRATMTDASRVWWVLAGVSAGLAAWTKNEGTVFLAVFLVLAVAWLVRRKGWGALRHVAPLVAGAAVGVSALLILKWRVPFTNDMVSALDFTAALARLRDLGRVQIVVESVGRELWFGGASIVGVLPLLVAYSIVAGIRRPRGAPAVALAAVVLQIAAYAIVYIVTPHDLGWHLNTSLERVVLQIFPTAVWAIMMVTR